MAIRHLFSDLIGSTLGYFRLGKTGPRLKDSSGDLIVRDSGDTTNVEVIAETFNASSDVGLVINSDAAGSGADWKTTIQRPASGQTANITFTLPPDDGSPGQVLSTDGSGVLTFVTAGSTASKLTMDTTTLNFGDSSPVTLFTLPANAVIEHVDVIPDTLFDDTPSVTVGIASGTAKYMGSADNSLTESAVWRTYPGNPSVGTTEALIATYSPAASTVGSARIIVAYSVPD